MTKSMAAWRLLLATTFLVTPAAVFAQETPPAEEQADQNSAEETTEETAGETDVSASGFDGEIVVQGKYSPDIVRTTPEVVTLLSEDDIARTGDGNIAGSLSRVSGLSVVGNGIVFVRGLGDRYSSALLNGSPLPSPEPLRRVVPLDIFPTSVIASSLVQKSYSANFPGEFGGGVINLTTKAVPTESFLEISIGGSGDSETTGLLGYTYFGGETDWTGFDNGSRGLTAPVAAFLSSGQRIGDLGVDQQAIAGAIVNADNGVIQKNNNIPMNFSGSLTGGTSVELGDGVYLGVIATGGINNKWRTRDITQQTAASETVLASDFRRVSTENRIVVNGLLGFGLEFGEHQIRWTNLYIRDTVKQTRLAEGEEQNLGDFSIVRQDTAWFERQLIDTQLVGEFQIGPVKLDVRGVYANSQREAPYELSFQYTRNEREGAVFGDFYQNNLNNGNPGSASVAFSDLNEDLWAGSFDLSGDIMDRVTLSAGYAYTDTKRYSERREFLFSAGGALNLPENEGFSLLRPDFLLSQDVVDYLNIGLSETTESNPAFEASLVTHAGYAQVQAELTMGLNVNLGVRYEDGKQSVSSVQIFTNSTALPSTTTLENSYWLPAATLTWEVAPDMQVRINGSKTIARPQFRELIFQRYYDPETNSEYLGNPLLQDSELTNAEIRYEYYYAPEQNISIAGFFKKIDKPIETFLSPEQSEFYTSFANAPTANLYGVEIDGVKFFDLVDVGGDFFSTRRLRISVNYTYTKSELKVADGDTVLDFLAVGPQPASNYFTDGSPLTGQSDHLVNVQIGMEDTDGLSQQTLLLSYASDRVTRRGSAGQPDVVESPGWKLDFVARQGITLGGQIIDLKFEARNLLGTDYEEFQDFETRRVFFNRYDVGTSFSVSASVEF